MFIVKAVGYNGPFSKGGEPGRTGSNSRQFALDQIQILLTKDEDLLVSICKPAEHIGRLGFLLDRTDERRIVLHRQLIRDRRRLVLTRNIVDQTPFPSEHLTPAASE